VLSVLVPVRRARARTETACLIAGFAGALVVLESFLLPFDLVVIQTGFLAGSVIFALGAAARTRVREGRTLGPVNALLGLVSLFSGGGFYLGAILAFVGGP
jgi:hypothetical protein